MSSDFANQFLNLDNAPPVDNEVMSMMNVKVRHEEPSTQTPTLLIIHVTIISKTSTAAAPTIPPTILPFTPLPQQLTPTPTPAPKTETTTTSIHALPDFSSLFGFDQRKAKDENKIYIDLVEKSVKDIIKDEVNSQLLHILPKKVSDYATLMIQSTITESPKNLILVKSSSQPKYTYEAAASLTKFELKKILLDKMQKTNRIEELKNTENSTMDWSNLTSLTRTSLNLMVKHIL
ncbi:hypothetical protein Tco_1199144 [Tanacetum coccineum]